jgi:diguanylate cyclase (GGDEF)-like protein
LFNDRLAQAIAAARRQQGSLTVLYVGVDRFKHVNYALGNYIGDHLLRSIAGRLIASVRASDTVSRWRGDEFAVLLPGLGHGEDAILSAQKILASVGAPHCIEKHDLQITATVGIGIYPDDGFEEPQCLELEITEHALVKDRQSVAAVHRLLRDMGVRLALDQFGTGPSSLTHLQRFPVDALKIDESLVHALCTRDNDGGIVNAVISAGNSFHLRVIAQGIETQEQFLALQSLQCIEGQGGYFRGAVPAGEFAQLLEDDCRLPIMA